MEDDTRSEKEVLSQLGVTAEELGRAARGGRIEIPARVDSTIRAAARERASRIRERGLRRRIVRLPVWIGSAAAAAAVLVAVGLWALGTSGAPRQAADGAAQRPSASASSPMDIDESGSVDIVDAFLMSRRLRELKEGGRAPEDWDFDRDGEVGEADVKAVAIAAVSL